MLGTRQDAINENVVAQSNGRAAWASFDSLERYCSINKTILRPKCDNLVLPRDCGPAEEISNANGGTVVINGGLNSLGGANGVYRLNGATMTSNNNSANLASTRTLVLGGTVGLTKTGGTLTTTAAAATVILASRATSATTGGLDVQGRQLRPRLHRQYQSDR